MHKKPKRPAPGLPFRSKLLPYETYIRAWMRAGKTYTQMAELLRNEHHLSVHRDTINSFVLVRARGHRRAVLPPEDSSTPAPATNQPSAAPHQRAPKDLQYPPAKADEL